MTLDEFLDYAAGDYQLHLPSVGWGVRECTVEAAPFLSAALNHANPRARIAAACTLLSLNARIGETVLSDEKKKASAKCVIESLQQGTDDERMFVCLMLCHGAAPIDAVPQLRDLLTSSDRRIRVCAAAALITIESTNAELISILVEGVHNGEDLAVCYGAAHAIARLIPHSTRLSQSLLSVLELAGAYDLQCTVLTVLQYLGEDACWATDTLLKFLRNAEREPKLRELAVRAVAETSKGATTATPSLVIALTSDHRVIVEAALDALVTLRQFTPDVVEGVSRLLCSQIVEVRTRAAQALEVMGESASASIPLMLDRLDNESDPDVQPYIAAALGAAGAEIVDPLIERLARQSDQNIRMLYAFALGSAGGAALARLIEFARQHLDDVARVAAVAGALSFMRGPAVAALGEMLLNETNEEVRYIILGSAKILGTHATPLVPALAKILEESDDNDYKQLVVDAIQSTGQGAKGAIPSLIRCFLSTADALARSAARALLNVEADSRPALEAAIRTAAPGEQARLKWLVKKLRPLDDGRFALFENLDDDKVVRTFVLVAGILEKRGETAFTEMEKILEKRKKNGTLSDSVSTQYRTLGKHIEKLEELTGPLTTRTWGKAGELSETGRTILPLAKDYLRMRERKKRSRRKKS